MSRWVMLLSVSFLVLSCGDPPKTAPERNYYVEIRTLQEDTFNRELSDYLLTNIPARKYTFTHQSSMAWPYFAAFELDETVPVDSLMPPHWYVHKMITRDSNTVMKRDDHLVRVEIMPHRDTLPNYQVEIYEFDSIGLKLTGSSGIHYVDTAAFSSLQDNRGISFPRQSLYNHYLKSIIRYSFK